DRGDPHGPPDPLTPGPKGCHPFATAASNKGLTLSQPPRRKRVSPFRNRRVEKGCHPFATGRRRGGSALEGEEAGEGRELGLGLLQSADEAEGAADGERGEGVGRVHRCERDRSAD